MTFFKSCTPCQAHQVANTKDTLIPHDAPKRAWHTLATDQFHWNGTKYLLIGNFYNKFPIIQILRNTSSSTIINHLKGIFDEHGIPERLIYDNGPQYRSEEFRVFSARYGFDHVTSLQWYPTSNGFIERTVQTVENMFTSRRKAVISLNWRCYASGQPQSITPCHLRASFSTEDDTNRIYLPIIPVE